MRGDYKLKAQSWTDLPSQYCDKNDQPREGMLPMINLIQRLASSSYANGLMACTSMWTLFVAQAEANLWPGPRLEIEFDPEKQQFSFAFTETLIGHAGKKKAPQWTRTASADEGFEVLERFLVKRARWFRKPAGAEEGSPSPSSA